MAKGERLPRFLKPMATLQNQPGLSTEESARECEVGLRQLGRDLRVLDLAGVPVYHDQGYRFTGKVRHKIDLFRWMKRFRYSTV